MKLQELYTVLKSVMSEADARYVIKKRLGLSTSTIIAEPDRKIDERAILEDIDRVKAGEPLSRIYGEREFWGLNFEISPATLDPRADTETLIEAVLARYKDNPPKTILDLGTGSGCILLSLLREFPDAKGVGVDQSAEALATAQNNAKTLGLDSRCRFIQSNWAESVNEKFDLIVSNPPYISSKVIPQLEKNVQKYDPILALDGGEDGLDAYKKIFSDLFRILNPGGFAFFEIGFDQGESVMRLSKESRFMKPTLHRDSAGHARVVEIFFSP